MNVQQPFVIDNTNPTKEERAKYIDAARANKFRVVGYFFSSEIQESLVRNRQRLGKEIVPEVGLRATGRKFQQPEYDEGFDELYLVKINSDGFTVKDVADEV